MKNTTITLIILFCIYVFAFLLKNNKTKNFQFLSIEHSNIYRGIATLLVILSHIAGKFGIRYFTPLGGIGVVIFLFSSGYGLNESYKKRGTKQYWIKKNIRILFPYSVIIIISIIMDLVFRRDINIPQYWYIPYIYFWYFIFWVIIKIPKLYDIKYIILSIISLLVICLGTPLQAEQAISFNIGVLFSEHYNIVLKLISDKKYFILLIISVIFLAVKQISFIRNLENTIIWNIIQLIMKVSAAIFIIIFVYKNVQIFNNILLETLGRASFEFYIIHFRLLGILGKDSQIYEIILFFLLTSIGSLVLYKITKQCLEIVNNNKFKIFKI